MAARSTFPLDVDPGGTNVGGAYNQNDGYRFALSVPMYLREVWVKADYDLTRFDVWRQSTQGLVATVDTTSGWSPVAGTVWHKRALSAGEVAAFGLLEANVTYVFAGHAPNGGSYYVVEAAPVPTSGEISIEGRVYGVVGTFPGTSSAAYPVFALVLDTSSAGALTYGGGTPSGPTVTTGDLASYLSADAGVNTHQGDLPWLTKQVVDGIAAAVTSAGTNIGTLLTRTAGLTGGTIQSAITAIDTAVANAKASIETKIAAAAAQITAIDNYLAPAIATILEKVGILPTGLYDLLVSFFLGTPTAAQVPLPGTGWTGSSATTGTGAVAITTPCDRIVFTITAFGSARVANEVAGVSFLTQPFWWVPLNGSQCGRYYTFRSLVTELYEPGQRLPGALVVVPPDIAWSYTCWSYAATPPTNPAG